MANDFLPFATGGSANVQSQVDYAAAGTTANGFAAGIAPSAELNKVWRQSSFVAAAIAKLIVDRLGVDVLDDGNLAAFVAKLLSTVQSISGRIKLTADTTFYVATTGNNANSGLVIGSPWLTIQHAIDVLANSYDLAGFTATIQLADGTYTGAASVSAPFLDGVVVINGNAATPSNVIISVTSNNAISVTNGAIISIQNCKLQTTTSGDCLLAQNGGIIYGKAGLVFGACANAHAHCVGGNIILQNNYTIAAGAQKHYSASYISKISVTGITITLTGTPAFSDTFANISDLSELVVSGNTFSGAATGSRYIVTVNGVINTNGGGASYLPGSIAGTAATGGLYL